MYKRIFFIAWVLTTVFSTAAQGLKPSDDASAIKFSIKNLGITVNGSFKGLKGDITFDPSAAANALFNLTVDAATVNTDNSTRDKHLKKEDYFNVNKFPFITFLSTKISASGKDGTFIVNGKITIKGTTKNISFPFTAQAQQHGYLFKGTFKLNRRDFKVGGGSLVLSDNLEVSFSVYAANKT